MISFRCWHAARSEGVFTRHQVLVNTSLLLLAGHETTINLLCNGTLAFTRHPDQWALLKQDPAGRPSRRPRSACATICPSISIQRIAAQDVEMRGKVMRKDDRIRWFISSANRDPDAFPEPGYVRHRPASEPACRLRVGHASLPRRNAGAGGRSGGLQGPGGTLPRPAGGHGGAGVSTQHHLPVAEIPACHLALGERQWRAS